MTFIGILLVKMVSTVYFLLQHHNLPALVFKLSVYDPASAIPVSDFPLSLLPEAPPTINCFQALDYLYVPPTLVSSYC